MSDYMNNIKCPSCGAENNSQSNFCIQCGTKLVQDNNVVSEQKVENSKQNINVVVNNQAVDNDEKEAKRLGIISLVLYFAGQLISVLLGSLLSGYLGESVMGLGGFCPLAGIVVMIVGRVKYPKNRFLKVVMWIIIASMIISIIFMILFVLWCYITCSNYDTSGCN